MWSLGGVSPSEVIVLPHTGRVLDPQGVADSGGAAVLITGGYDFATKTLEGWIW